MGDSRKRADKDVERASEMDLEGGADAVYKAL